MKTKALLTFAALGIYAATSYGGLSVSNGDFENNPVQTADVVGWFDRGVTGNWWESTWAGPTVSPNGTPVLGLSYMYQTLNWAYQSIGVNDGGLTSFALQYDVGSFTDAGGPRDFGLTFSVYKVDGTFAGGADDVDLVGAAGATLLDTITVFSGALDPGQMLTGQTVSFNIAGSAGSELFLRLQNEVGTVGEPWTAVDNIQIVPEPSAMALGGLSLLFSAICRRNRKA